jgi:hypothetical protein
MGESVRDQLFTLYDQGFLPKSEETKAICKVSKTRYNRYYDWQRLRGKTPPGEDGGGPKDSAITHQAKVPPGAPVAVGKIVIIPENWSMSQMEAMTILDTFIKDRQNINYIGTVGNHIADVYKYYRRIMGYEEVSYDGEGSQRDISGGGDGAQSVGPSVAPKQQ